MKLKENRVPDAQWHWPAIIAVIAFVLIYLVALDWRPLVVPDEARYAAIPLEMIQTGDWTVPHLLGVEYFEKPVAGYWLTAAAFQVFGDNTFALRLPSALASALAAIVVFVIARRATGRRDLAALSSLVLLTMIEPSILGTTAVLDAPFSALVTLTIGCFWMGFSSKGAPRFWWLAAAGGAAGAAFLIKGFLGFVIPGMVLAPWLAWCQQWRALFLWPWICLAGALVVAGPWSLAVHSANGDYWHYFFWVEHINRFLGGAKAQHPEPWWYFLAILPVGMIPWIFAAPLAAAGAARRGFGSPWSKLLLCWIALPLAFFSVSSGKLPTYILPLFPPLAIVITCGLYTWFTRPLPAPSFKAFLPALLLFVFAFIAVVVWLVLSPEQGPWEDGGTWRFPVAAIALVLWGLIEIAANQSSSADRRLLLNGMAPVAMLVLVPMLMPTGYMQVSKVPEHVLDPIAAKWPDAALLGDEDLAHAVGWAWRRPRDVVIFGGPGELKWGLETYEHNASKIVGPEDLASIVNGRSGPVVVALTKIWPSWGLDDLSHLPPHERFDDRGISVLVWPGPNQPVETSSATSGS
ncbi:MAG: phospholipid carrier-dependent glycosyltransferase [Phycisphaerales bacterium]|nr:phospholipid carrier-dependent glycosyltransferase [Phycisphaerales bacterium]